MMKTHEELASEIASLRRREDRLKGQLDAASSQLKEEFGVSSFEAAREKALKLEKKATAAEEKAREAREAWEKEWGEKIKGAGK